ncbi:hypothetical protein [Paracoccus aminovorans]|uniref:hypothetical protein n=1 Tax=Paracoccus aminovorans TaxID=34004 RepID=UPI0007843E69|nr:hypothetical protein [Paracoccus aminovorans]
MPTIGVATYGIVRGPAGDGITPGERDKIDEAVAAAEDLAVALPQVDQAREDAQAAAGQAAGDRAATEAARTAAEGYASAAAQSAQFYDTIVAGRAAVADGEQFGVRAGGSDGLTRPTIYRRDSATAQIAMVTIVNPSEVDDIDARTSQIDEVQDAPADMVPILHVPSDDDETRAVIVAGYDPATNEIVMDRLRVLELDAPVSPEVDDAIAAVQQSVSGMQESVDAAGLEVIEDDPEGAALLDDYIILKHAPSDTDPTRAIVLERYNITTGRIESIAEGAADQDYLPWLPTPEGAYPPSTLVNPETGATIPVSSNDSEGRRRFQRMWDQDAIYVLMWIGQSLNAGQFSLLHLPYASGTPEYEAIMARTWAPLTTVEQNLWPTKALMPTGGSHIMFQTWTGLEPLHEYSNVPAGTSSPSGETPVSQAVFQILRQIQADFPGISADDLPTIVGVNASVGSSSILNLGPGRPTWDEQIRFFRWLTDYAEAQGKRVVLLGAQYRGFEADWDVARPLDPWGSTSGADVIRGRETETLMHTMSKLQQDMEETIRPITGQKERIKVFWDQVQVGNSSYNAITHNPKATRAQLECWRVNPWLVPMGSKGASPGNIYDFVHPSPYGYAWQGQFDGVVMYRELFSVEGWVPLRCLEAWRSGLRTFDLRFSSQVTLLTDDSIVDVTALGAGKGVQVLGDTNLAISSVMSVAPDTMRVTLAADPPTTYRQYQANIGLVSRLNHRGNRTGARTAIVAGYGTTVSSLFTAAHPQPAFEGEANDLGDVWWDYPDTFPGLQMAAHQQILIESN